MHAQTIDDVVTILDQIIDENHRDGSRIGYFAALYHHVAIAFRDAIAGDVFEDARRMERLDVAFFNRYLTALQRFRGGARPTRSWLVAFEATQEEEHIVLQHLLLGMSAHINFDLGIAVASICPASDLPAMRGDFDKMNAILASLLSIVESDLTVLWPPLGLLHTFGGNIEDGIINFSMRKARQHAWQFAVELAALPGERRAAKIAEEDAWVAELGHDIRRPGLLLGPAIAFIRSRERYDVSQIIDILVNKVGPVTSRGRHVARPRRRGAAKAVAAETRKLRPPRRQKIAILGGGVGAMTTAFALTDPENPLHDEYDITIYQMGWRLGGKGASGRNAEHSHRIEEHGLHLWFGCYDNAFRMMRTCYAELGRAPDAPLATWRDAFAPHSFIVLKEQAGDRWHNWKGDLPTNDMVPGDGCGLLPLWDYVALAVEVLYETARHSRLLRSPTGDVEVDPARGWRDYLDVLASDLEGEAASKIFELLHTSHRLAKRLDRDASVMVGILDRCLAWIWRRLGPRVESDAEVRHEWVLYNFFYANIRGVVAENAMARGLEVLNEYDYREFLLEYGYDDGGVMANSAWVLGIYDGVFAYVDGDNRIPPGAPFPPKAKVEAGSVIRAGIRQFLAYAGASIWKMQAGMGDTVFAPLYQILRERGVKFEMFHKVERLIPSADGRRIERVAIARQVDVIPAQRARGGYDPLVDVNGLPCWPSEPRWEQLVDGKRLKKKGVDLESYASSLPPAGERVLEAGKDFDVIVLGISLGALPYICGDLIQVNARWKRMVETVQTIRTQAFQVWLAPTTFELGWTLMERPVVTCYEVSPLNTWADMSHLIPREAWPAAPAPLNISYFCGPMLDDAIRMTASGPKEHRRQLEQPRQNAKAKAAALRYLEKDVGLLWPRAVDAEGRFRWDLLVDPGERTRHGAARFEAQYWRANVQPSERYVLSVPGSSKHRLPAHDPQGFANLVLAGDWTHNNFNLGCVEAAVMSGLLASHALTGYPVRDDIVGMEF